MCKYLSLRGCLFSDFNVGHLPLLEFIDIRGTNMTNLDLRMCTLIKLVVIDAS